jgi:hypothetical protein
VSTYELQSNPGRFIPLYQTHEERVWKICVLWSCAFLVAREQGSVAGGKGDRNAVVGLNNVTNVHFHLLVWHYNYTRFG